MRAACRDTGFALLEGLVALVILGLTLIPVAAFVSQSVLQLRVIGDSNARQLAQQNIMAFLETLNPMDAPTGAVELGEISLSWASEPVITPNTSIRTGTGLGGYAVGLYRVTAQVHRGPTREPWFEFQARKIGYRRLQIVGATGEP